MKIRMIHGLPFVTVTLTHKNQELELKQVLLDTGSAGTLFSIDSVEKIGLAPTEDDFIHRVYGVGGCEFVFTKQIDQLSLSEFQLPNFTLELGEVNYGIEMDGILGIDFLSQVGAIIDLSTLSLYSKG